MEGSGKGNNSWIEMVVDSNGIAGQQWWIMLEVIPDNNTDSSGDGGRDYFFYNVKIHRAHSGCYVMFVMFFIWMIICNYAHDQISAQYNHKDPPVYY